MKNVLYASLSAVGAIIGAGFASGREIDSFFSRYGMWSWVGIAAAAAVVMLLGMRIVQHPEQGGMPTGWQGKWQGTLWKTMFGLLLASTGGAMLAGGGEIAALMLPVRGAYLIGFICTMSATVLLARKGLEASGLASGVLVILLLTLVAAGMMQQPEKAVVLPDGGLVQSLLHGSAYAGFNMALAAPALCISVNRLTGRERKQVVLLLVMMLATLLGAGNGLLLRHSALGGSAMPYIQLLMKWGRGGYWLGGGCMYAAVLTTACASYRGLKVVVGSRRGIAEASCMLLFACIGFSGVVDMVYPLLGASCLALMAASFLLEK